MNYKILCFHGYRQCGTTFREKSGGFRKAFKGKYEFVFVDAFNKIDEDADIKEYAWWFSNEKNYFNALDSSNCNKGFDKSLDLIKSVFKEQGPFNGILGFSQGACFVQILLHLIETDLELARLINIKFAILVSSFYSKSSQFIEFYKSQINTPSLLIYGTSDKIIPPELSIETLDIFNDKTVIVHDGGHYMPMNPKIKETLSLFLSRFIQ